MTTDNKTLADVQPGGRVRLGDQAERARFEAWASEHKYSVAMDGEQYEFAAARLMWKAWRAAFASGAAAAVTGTVLVNMGDGEADFIRANDEEAAPSAQPSPGGQGDALLPCPFCGESLTINGAGDGVHPRDSDCILAQHVVVADHAPHAAAWNRRALAARQPVGEPVGVEIRREGDRTFPRVMKQDHAEAFLRTCNVGPLPTLHALYAAPAQAVDLGQLQRYESIGSDGMNMERVSDGRWVKLDDVRALIDSHTEVQS